MPAGNATLVCLERPIAREWKIVNSRLAGLRRVLGLIPLLTSGLALAMCVWHVRNVSAEPYAER
jgi:hypothetical protein